MIDISDVKKLLALDKDAVEFCPRTHGNYLSGSKRLIIEEYTTGQKNSISIREMP